MPFKKQETYFEHILTSGENILNHQASTNANDNGYCNLNNKPQGGHIVYKHTFENLTKYIDDKQNTKICETITSVNKDGSAILGEVGFAKVYTHFYENHGYYHDNNEYTVKVLYPTQLSIDYDGYKNENKTLKWDGDTEIIDCTEEFSGNTVMHKNVFVRFPSFDFINFKDPSIENYNSSFRPNYTFKYDVSSLNNDELGISGEDAINVFNVSTGTLSLKSEYLKNNSTVTIIGEVLESYDSFFKKGTGDGSEVPYIVKFYKQLPMKYEIENNTQIVYLSEEIENEIKEKQQNAEKAQIETGFTPTPVIFNFSNYDSNSPLEQFTLKIKDNTEPSLSYTFQVNSPTVTANLKLGHTYNLTFISKKNQKLYNIFTTGKEENQLLNGTSFTFSVGQNSKNYKVIKTDSTHTYGVMDPQPENDKTADKDWILAQTNSVSIKDVCIGVQDVKRQKTLIAFQVKDQSGTLLSKGTNYTLGDITNSDGTVLGNDDFKDVSNNFASNELLNGYTVAEITNNYEIIFKITIKGKSGTIYEGQETIFAINTNKKLTDSTNGFKKVESQTINNETLDCYTRNSAVILKGNDGRIRIKPYYTKDGSTMEDLFISFKIYLSTDSTGENWQKTYTIQLSSSQKYIDLKNIKNDYKRIKLESLYNNWNFICDGKYANNIIKTITNSKDVKLKVRLFYKPTTGIDEAENLSGQKLEIWIPNSININYIRGINNSSTIKGGNCVPNGFCSDTTFYNVTGFYKMMSSSKWGFLNSNSYSKNDSKVIFYNNGNSSKKIELSFNDVYTSSAKITLSNVVNCCWYWNSGNGLIRMKESSIINQTSVLFGSQVPKNQQENSFYSNSEIWAQLLLVKNSSAIQDTNFESYNYGFPIDDVTPPIIGPLNSAPTVYGASNPYNNDDPSVISNITTEEDIVFDLNDDSSNSEFNIDEDVISRNTNGNIIFSSGYVDEYSGNKQNYYENAGDGEETFTNIQIEELPELFLPSDITNENRNKIEYSSSNIEVADIVYYDYDPEFGTETSIDDPSQASKQLKPKLLIHNIGESTITAMYPDGESNDYATNQVSYKLIVKKKGQPSLKLAEDKFEITREVAATIDESNNNQDPLSSNQTFQSPVPEVICEEDIPIKFEYSSSNEQIGKVYGETGVIIISDVGIIKVTIKLKETPKFRSAEVSYTLKINPPKAKTPTIIETEKGYYKIRFSQYTDKPIYRIYDRYQTTENGLVKHLVAEINSKTKFKNIKEGLDLEELNVDQNKKNLKEFFVNPGSITYKLTYNDGKTPFKYHFYSEEIEEVTDILQLDNFKDEFNGDVKVFDTENIVYSEDLKNATVKLNCSVVCEPNDSTYYPIYYIFNKSLQQRLKNDMNSFKKGDIPGTFIGYIDYHLVTIKQEDEDILQEVDTYPTYSANFESYGYQMKTTEEDDEGNIINVIKAFKHAQEGDVDNILVEIGTSNNTKIFVDKDNAISDLNELLVKQDYDDDDLTYQIFKCPYTTNNTDNDVKYTFSSSIPEIANPNESGDVVIYKPGKVKIMINSSESENFTSGETGYVLEIIAKEDPILTTVYNKYVYIFNDKLLENVFECPEITWSNTDPEAKLVFRIHDGGDFDNALWLTTDDLDDIFYEETEDEEIPDEHIDDDEGGENTEEEQEINQYKIYIDGINTDIILDKNDSAENPMIELLKSAAAEDSSFIEIIKEKIKIKNYTITYKSWDGSINIFDSSIEPLKSYLKSKSGIGQNGNPSNIKILLLSFKQIENNVPLFNIKDTILNNMEVDKINKICKITAKLNVLPVLDKNGQIYCYNLPTDFTDVNRDFSNTWYVLDNNIWIGYGPDLQCYSDNFKKMYITLQDGTIVDKVDTNTMDILRNWLGEDHNFIYSFKNSSSQRIEYVYLNQSSEENEEELPTEGETEEESEEKKKVPLKDFKEEIEVKFEDEDGVENTSIVKIDNGGNISIGYSKETNKGPMNRVINVLVKSVETENFNARYHVYNLLISPNLNQNPTIGPENPVVQYKVNGIPNTNDETDFNPETIEHNNTDINELEMQYGIYIGGILNEEPWTNATQITVMYDVGGINKTINITNEKTDNPYIATNFAKEATRFKLQEANDNSISPKLPIQDPEDLLSSFKTTILETDPTDPTKTIESEKEHYYRYQSGKENSDEGKIQILAIYPGIGNNLSGTIKINRNTGVITLPNNLYNYTINVIVYLNKTTHFNSSCGFYNIEVKKKEEVHLSLKNVEDNELKIYKELCPGIGKYRTFIFPQIITNNTDTDEIEYIPMIRDVGAVYHNMNPPTGETIKFSNQYQDGDDYWQTENGHYCIDYKDEDKFHTGISTLPFFANGKQYFSEYTSHQGPFPIDNGNFKLYKNGNIEFGEYAGRHVCNVMVISKETSNFCAGELFFNLEIIKKEKPLISVFPRLRVLRFEDSPQYVEAPKISSTNNDPEAKLIVKFLKSGDNNIKESTGGNAITYGNSITINGETVNATSNTDYSSSPFETDNSGNVIINNESDPYLKEESNSNHTKSIALRIYSPATTNFGEMDETFGIVVKGRKDPQLTVPNSTVKLTRTVVVGSEVFPPPAITHKNTDKGAKVTMISGDTSILGITPKGAFIVYKTTATGATVTVTVRLNHTENFVGYGPGEAKPEKTFNVQIEQQVIPAV